MQCGEKKIFHPPQKKNMTWKGYVKFPSNITAEHETPRDVNQYTPVFN